MTTIISNDQNDTENNTVVELLIQGSDGNHYRCVGVLMWEKDSICRIGFNAKNDEVIDFLDLNKKEILEMRKVEENEIKLLG